MASNASIESLTDSLKRKSLTPQRKHHKLLKDGSEVWSQEVEKIFVDGLHKYWESPWATYSRGRSRWRNQFLVEHLKKHGIDRSKKQVASHIQVLRNMWRGEPEFHLVAGGEELFQENGLLASPQSTASTSSPEQHPSTSLDGSDWRNSWSSSASSTPEYSTTEFPYDIMPSSAGPQLAAQPMSYIAVDPAMGPTAGPSRCVPDPFATVTPATARPHSVQPVKLEPLSLGPTLFNLPQTSAFSDAPEGQPAAYAPNRLRHLNLYMGSTTLAMIDVDRLIAGSATGSPQPPSPCRILLRIQVRVPPADVHTASMFQTVEGIASFAAPWAVAAKCHTKLWTGKTCVKHEVGYCEQQQAPAGGSTLPQSSLTSCRWLDPAIQTITQQFVVDREVLAVVIYVLDRTGGAGTEPRADLIGFHKYPWQTPSSQPLASPPTSPVSSALFPAAHRGAAAPQIPLFARPPSLGEDVPLSYALDPSRAAAMSAGGASPHTSAPRSFR